MFISSSSPTIHINGRSESFKDEILERAGIIDRRRVIHIFFDPKQPNSCKVIQINISVTKGAGVLFDKYFMNKSNGTLSFVAVYVYDCTLNLMDKTLKEQFAHGKLTLLTAKRLDRETDFDAGITRNEHAQLYSNFYNNYNVSEYVDSRVMVAPFYYTQEHEYFERGDFSPFGLYEDLCSAFTITGSDIIDDVTELFQQNPDSFKTARDTLLFADSKILFGTGMNSAASESIGEVNFILGCDTMVNGGVFVYDTQMGMKFDKPSVLNKPYMSPTQSDIEIETFLTAMKMQANSIENTHGSIRVMYAPSLIGSKCRVIFKDHGMKTSDHGLSDASKDSSYEVTETIGRNIDDNSIFVNKHLVDGIGMPFYEQEKLKI